jgi:hypothetical protein
MNTTSGFRIAIQSPGDVEMWRVKRQAEELKGALEGVQNPDEALPPDTINPYGLFPPEPEDVKVSVSSFLERLDGYRQPTVADMKKQVGKDAKNFKSDGIFWGVMGSIMIPMGVIGGAVMAIGGAGLMAVLLPVTGILGGLSMLGKCGKSMEQAKTLKQFGTELYQWGEAIFKTSSQPPDVQTLLPKQAA